MQDLNHQSKLLVKTEAQIMGIVVAIAFVYSLLCWHKAPDKHPDTDARLAMSRIHSAAYLHP